MASPGSRIRAARKAAGLRQLDLARMTGRDQSAVSRWERGRDLPTDPRVRAVLARELGVTL